MTLRSYNVIYDLVDDVRAAMEGRLNTVEERTQIGEAEVRPIERALATGTRSQAAPSSIIVQCRNVSSLMSNGFVCISLASCC